MNTQIKRIKCGNGNCYILSQGESAILVDTGRTKFREKIIEKCKEFNVQLIILTHGHVDHIQNAAYLSKKLSAPIAISRKDLDLIKDNMLQPLKAGTFLGKIVLALSIKSFKSDYIEEFSPTVFLGGVRILIVMM